MNKPQMAAFTKPCYLATETFSDRFTWLAPDGSYSVILTLNAGYE